MSFLIVYILINAGISLYLAKSHYKFKIAAIVHAVSFCVVLFFMLLAQNGVTSQLFSAVFGEETYSALHNVVIYGASDFTYQMMSTEMTVSLLALIIGIVCAFEFVERIKKERARPVRRLITPAPERFLCKTVNYENKLYIFNCVMRC